MKSFNDRRKSKRNINEISKFVTNEQKEEVEDVGNVSLYGEEYKNYIDREYQKIHNHLCDKIGEDKVNRINEEMDKQLMIAIEREFAKFASSKDILR